MEAYARAYLQDLPELLLHRATKGYRKLRFLRYVQKQKAVRQICDLVAPLGQFSVVFFGDWSGGAKSPVSRRASGPLQEIRRRLRESRHVDLREVNEYRSSQVCCCCEGQLSKARGVVTSVRRSLAGGVEMRKRRGRIHGVLHCKSSERLGGACATRPCGMSWDRDVNAANNLLRLGALDALGLSRPDAFLRTRRTHDAETREIAAHAALSDQRPSAPAILGAQERARSLANGIHIRRQVRRPDLYTCSGVNLA
jgi:hypothetical protein